VGLTELRERYPHQLSGGQQQRVALARALAVAPRVVLLDEPFAALDASLRGELRRDVARILVQTASTAVLVTHDREEALELSDQIAVLVDGEVRGLGGPRALYRDPPDAATAASIGDVNLLAAKLRGDRADCALGEIRLTGPATGAGERRGTLLLRPEQLALRSAPGPRLTAASVVEVRYHGHDALARVCLHAAAPAPVLLARIPGERAPAPGQAVWIEVLGAGRAWAES
jgi:iron(III) transport system ATP-binding protein